VAAVEARSWAAGYHMLILCSVFKLCLDKAVETRVTATATTYISTSWHDAL